MIFKIVPGLQPANSLVFMPQGHVEGLTLPMYWVWVEAFQDLDIQFLLGLTISALVVRASDSQSNSHRSGAQDR